MDKVRMFTVEDADGEKFVYAAFSKEDAVREYYQNHDFLEPKSTTENDPGEWHFVGGDMEAGDEPVGGYWNADNGVAAGTTEQWLEGIHLTDTIRAVELWSTVF